MIGILAVALGASIGAPLRYLVDRSITARTAGPAGAAIFPWGLLTVNVEGSAIVGPVLALTDGNLRLFLMTGICGSLTTFSGFGWETNRLWSVHRVAFWSVLLVMPLACTAAFLVFYTLSTVIHPT